MSRQRPDMEAPSVRTTRSSKQSRSAIHSKNSFHTLLTSDCESLNGGTQSYRTPRISQSSATNARSVSDSPEDGSSSGAANSGKTGNGENEDDEDGSSDEADDDDDEEPEVFVPSGESRKGKGKQTNTVRPRIVVEDASDASDSRDTFIKAKIHRTGQSTDGPSSRRSIRNTSVLREDEDSSMGNAGSGVDYPRKKSARRLSNSNGFLAYNNAEPDNEQEESIQMHGKNEEAVTSSDDDMYKGVELISESEEDDPDVEEAEARIIIDSEEETDGHLRAGLSIHRSGTALSGRTSDWGDFDLDDGLLLDNVPFFHEHYNPAGHSHNNGLNLFNVPHNAGSDFHDRAPPPRRVRFQDDAHTTDSTSTITSDEDDDIFPDLFLHQDRLDPAFRRMIENDQDGDGNALIGDSDDGSYWDFRGSDDFEQEANSPHGSSDGEGSVGSSSGYESDEGETTDEDLPPLPAVTRSRSLLRRPSTAPIVGDGDNSRAFFPRSISQASRRVGPSMGSWVADPSKPIAVIDSSGKRMLIFPATQPTGSSRFRPAGSSDSSVIGNSPRTSFANYMDDSDGDDYSSQEFGNTFGFSGGNLMMGGLLHGAPGSDFLLGGGFLGPPETFYPFTSVGPTGLIAEDEDEFEDEDLWKVEDFIDFGDGSSSSDNDDDQATEVPNSPTISMNGCSLSSQQNTPEKVRASTNGQDTTQSMISHFDKGVVGAFRRNQHRHRQFLARPGPRAFTPTITTSLGGMAIKGGRHTAANSPITPMRKRKADHVFGGNPSGGQLAGIGAKRRMLNAHRRTKSAF